MIWGLKDTAILSGHLSGLDKWVTNLSVKLYPDDDHWVMLAKNKPVAQDIRRFIDDKNFPKESVYRASDEVTLVEPSRRVFLASLVACGRAADDRTLGRTAARRSGPGGLAPPQGGRLLGTVPLGRFDGLPVPPLGQLLRSGPRCAPVHRSQRARRRIRSSRRRISSSCARRRLRRTPLARLSRIRVNGPQGFEITPAELIAQSAADGDTPPGVLGQLRTRPTSGSSAPRPGRACHLAALLDRARAPATSIVRVTGFDDTQQQTQTSVAGRGLDLRARRSRTGGRLPGHRR